ncbi:MAG: hypothetical protein R3C13_09650 [Hyphomonas sp.]|uniref:hypothetical protein n=1 Tax=Hyphomonas sp. TaxID=87 RepID=UPI0035270DC6
MSGFLKTVVLFATLVGGWLALDYVWTGSLQPHAAEIGASFGILTFIGAVLNLLSARRSQP